MENNKNKMIPDQQKGSETDNISELQFDNETAAKAFYKIVKQRLLNVNGWHQLAGTGTAEFKLADADGNEVNRPVQKGDHFKIDIPGPGPITGDGYDWVHVEAVEETDEEGKEQTAIQVRPATNPNNERKDVAHFFTKEASSSFIVRRSGNTVYAEVHGRNEKPNTNAETLVDKTRNAAVAAGAITGFSKLQWKSLVDGLLKKED
jgi:hypothetical protein